MMTLNIYDGFSLNLGSLDVSLDLVAATSSEGSDPKVVGPILNSEGAARSTPGAVSDTRLLQRPGH